MIWNDLTKLINENQTFCISSHVSHDADNVGSQLAFYWYLSSLGKDVAIYNLDELPKKFHFFKNSDKIKNVEPQGKLDVIAVLDSSNMGRTNWDGIESKANKFIDIDHHRDNSRFGTVNAVDTTAAATCQIVYRFFVENDIDFPDYVAEALYGGILADTGGFQFNNTSSDVLRAAADLVDRGANLTRAYKELFATYSIGGLKLRSAIWSTLEFFGDHKIGVVSMERNMIDTFGADRGDTEGMSDLTLTAEGVEVGLFAKYNDEEVRFSLRSAGRVDVGNIAASVAGGGGHSCAAGCSIVGASFEEARDLIVNKILEVL